MLSLSIRQITIIDIREKFELFIINTVSNLIRATRLDTKPISLIISLEFNN